MPIFILRKTPQQGVEKTKIEVTAAPMPKEYPEMKCETTGSQRQAMGKIYRAVKKVIQGRTVGKALARVMQEQVLKEEEKEPCRREGQHKKIEGQGGAYGRRHSAGKALVLMKTEEPNRLGHALSAIASINAFKNSLLHKPCPPPTLPPAPRPILHFDNLVLELYLNEEEIRYLMEDKEEAGREKLRGLEAGGYLEVSRVRQRLAKQRQTAQFAHREKLLRIESRIRKQKRLQMAATPITPTEESCLFFTPVAPRFPDLDGLNTFQYLFQQLNKQQTVACQLIQKTARTERHSLEAMERGHYLNLIGAGGIVGCVDWCLPDLAYYQTSSIPTALQTGRNSSVPLLPTIN